MDKSTAAWIGGKFSGTRGSYTNGAIYQYGTTTQKKVNPPPIAVTHPQKPLPKLGD